MPSPRFSIVIPTYNRSELVGGAVRSVLAQTFGDLEVVVSDNCSDDDTPHVIQGFQDPRVRYVRTPTHTSIAGSWEFARCQARGSLLLMLSDDDALVPRALDRFVEERQRYNADFLFCNVAEYRDRSFVGSDRNTVSCGPFSGAARPVAKAEFLTALFGFRPIVNMHPSAFVFSATLAAKVVQRCGSFFRTNGVEYFAWPPCAALSQCLVHIDAPLVILGRTFKSWGSTIVLSNPGKDQIAKMIADVEHKRDWIPLANFTLINLMAEGMLLSKRTFAEELQPYSFDERQYLTRTMRELRNRRAMGVDVSEETAELLEYASKYPDLKAEFLAPAPNGFDGRSRLRAAAKTIGLHHVVHRWTAARTRRKIRRRDVKSGFIVSGNDFGFQDAAGCANFVATITDQ